MKPIKARVKRIFVAGLLVLVPASVTFFLLVKLVQWTDSLLRVTFPLPRILAWPGLGLIFLAALVFLVGLVATNFIGRRVVNFGERILEKIPVVSSIYVGAKTLVEAFTLPSAAAFRQVVLVEYPRKGIWALGFITKDSEVKEGQEVGDDWLNVFVPTAPNPTSGMVLVVPRRDVAYLDLSVREAVEFIVSGGVLSPLRMKGQTHDKGKPTQTGWRGIGSLRRAVREGGGRPVDPRAV